MLSFKELTTSLLSYLREKLPGVSVQFGQYGELPSVTPAILIYAEPYGGGKDSRGKRKVRFIKFTVFSLEGGNESIETSIFKSFELLEKTEDLINAFEIEKGIDLSFSDDPIDFDAVYNNIAVCYLEFISPYRRHQDV